MNIILEERYKGVPDEVIQYALGLWGEEESSSMDTNIREKILSRPRAKELASWQHPQPSLKEVRLKYGGPGVSDDDLLLRYFAGKDEVDAMRAAQVSKRHVSVGYPVLGLIEKLNKATNCNYIQVRKGGLSLTLK